MSTADKPNRKMFYLRANWKEGYSLAGWLIFPNPVGGFGGLLAVLAS